MRPLLALACLAGCALTPDPGLRVDPSPPPGALTGVFRARDGTQLAAIHWKATTPEPRAVVVIVHGLKDHSRNYVAIAARLTAAGYDVHAVDLRGHGRSAGPRAAPTSFDQYTDDIDRFVSSVEASSPGRKVFLFGHSMGGAIATLVAIDHQPPLAGLLLSAPAVAVDAPPMFLALTQLFGALLPRARVFDLANRDFSSDPAVRRSMDLDPLISQGPGPARTAIGLVNGMRMIWERSHRLTIPVLAMHGTRDSLTAPSGSRALINSVPSTDRTLRIYEGLHHNLLHEPKRQQVEDDIVAWLDARTGGDPSTSPPMYRGSLRGDPIGWTQALQIGGGLTEGLGFVGTTSFQFARPRPLGYHGSFNAEMVGDYKAISVRPLGLGLRIDGAVFGATAGGAFIKGARPALSFGLWAELPLGPMHVTLLGQRMRRIKDSTGLGPIDSDQLWTSASLRYGGDRYYWPHARAGVGPVLTGGCVWLGDERTWFATIGVQLYGVD